MTTEGDIRKIKAAGVKQNYFYHTNVDEGLIDSFPTRTVLRVAYKKLTRAFLKRGFYLFSCHHRIHQSLFLQPISY